MFFIAKTTARCVSAQVDIWNATTGEWTVARLTQPRQYITGANAGPRVVFAGGFCSPCTGQSGTSRSHVADIFDSRTGLWTSHELAQKRSNLAATSVGGRYAVFSGGTDDGNSSAKVISRSSMVDIYDGVLDKWTTATLGSARCCLGAAGGNHTAAMAGGDVNGGADVFIFTAAT